MSKNNQAEINIKGGVGYVPITFTGLTSYTAHELKIFHNNKGGKSRPKGTWK